MEENETYIYGIRAVEEALVTARGIVKILLRNGAKGEQFKTIIEQAKAKNIRLQYTTDDVLDRITTNVHQGAIAVLNGVEYVELSDVCNKNLVLVLDGITDVRNFGAIARSANCFGVDAIIVPQKGSAPINGESIKASVGALLYTPVCLTSNNFYAVKTLLNNGFQVIACTEKAEKSFTQVDYRGKTVIIMGSEGKGISSQLLKLATDKVQIPMYGNVSSLNVSVATGIILSAVAQNRHA